ncbi:MAG: hypothetical protein GEU28_12035 [Dehalococcoidia bacterium]|nr:hypothetical protein [Dehalococcoidia bacterium]
MEIEDYFNELVLKLEQHTGGSFKPQIEIEYEDEEWGALDDTLHLPGGFRLDINLSVDMRPQPARRAYPAWRLYAFQLRDPQDQLIWRFDDWPHHPGFSGFPHHKHNGADGNASEGRIASIRQLLDVIEGSLPQTSHSDQTP